MAYPPLISNSILEFSSNGGNAHSNYRPIVTSFFSFQNLTCCFFFLICITRDVRQILRNLFRCLGDIREPEVWLFTENQNTGWIYILSCSGLFIHKNPLTRTLGHIFILWIMYPNVPWNPLNVIHITIIDKHKFTDIFLWPPSVFFFLLLLLLSEMSFVWNLRRFGNSMYIRYKGNQFTVYSLRIPLNHTPDHLDIRLQSWTFNFFFFSVLKYLDFELA